MSRREDRYQRMVYALNVFAMLLVGLSALGDALHGDRLPVVILSGAAVVALFSVTLLLRSGRR